MINLGLYSTFLASVVFLLLTPGPVIALITGTAATQGRLKALKTAFGTNAASLVLIAIAILAICGFISINKYFIYIIGLVGSTYIAYSSFMHVRIALKGTEQSKEQIKQGGFIHGFTIAISNPKDIFFFISFFPQFVGITDNTSISLGILCISWIVLDLSVLSGYILLVHRMMSGKISKALDVISTLFLLVIAIIGFIYNIRMLLVQLAVN